MRFAFIHTHARTFHIVTLCGWEVSKAGYYAWRARRLSEREQTNRAVTEQIRTIHRRVNARYGSPRMHVELTAQGIVCGETPRRPAHAPRGRPHDEHTQVSGDHAQRRGSTGCA